MKLLVEVGYSQAAANALSQKYHASETVVGFTGKVDTDYAAYYISTAIAYFRGDLDQARQIIGKLNQVMIGKLLEPAKYNHWLLAIIPEPIAPAPSYYSQWIRGIDFIKYGEHPYGPYSDSVKYTHPDIYGYYIYMEIETEYTLGTNYRGNNLQAEHISKSNANTYNPLLIFEYGFGGAGLAIIAAWAGAAIASALIVFCSWLSLSLYHGSLTHTLETNQDLAGASAKTDMPGYSDLV